jgi:hypothetical protein
MIEEFEFDLKDPTLPWTENRVVHLAASTGNLELLRYMIDEMPETPTQKRPLLDCRPIGSVVWSTVLKDCLDCFKFIIGKHPEVVEECDEAGCPSFGSLLFGDPLLKHHNRHLL